MKRNSQPSIGEKEPGITGVFHGPYPNNGDHPSADGNTIAIREALNSGRIDIDRANELQGRVSETVREDTGLNYTDIGAVAIKVEYPRDRGQDIPVHVSSH